MPRRRSRRRSKRRSRTRRRSKSRSRRRSKSRTRSKRRKSRKSRKARKARSRRRRSATEAEKTKPVSKKRLKTFLQYLTIIAGLMAISYVLGGRPKDARVIDQGSFCPGPGGKFIGGMIMDDIQVGDPYSIRTLSLNLGGYTTSRWLGEAFQHHYIDVVNPRKGGCSTTLGITTNKNAKIYGDLLIKSPDELMRKLLIKINKDCSQREDRDNCLKSLANQFRINFIKRDGMYAQGKEVYNGNLSVDQVAFIRAAHAHKNDEAYKEGNALNSIDTALIDQYATFLPVCWGRNNCVSSAKMFINNAYRSSR